MRGVAGYDTVRSGLANVQTGASRVVRLAGRGTIDAMFAFRDDALGLFAGGRGVPRSLRRQIRALSRSGLFDADWYAAQYPQVRGSGLDPLSHYVVRGVEEGLRPNPLFDSRWYLDAYPDVGRSGLNPLYHYVLRGAAEGRAAGAEFDTAAYLDQNPDVARSGMNPLRHYLRHGAREGRMATPATVPARRPTAPEPGAWAGLAPRAHVRDAVLDVIVPVYRGLDDTLACLHSVLSARAGMPFELVVLDDFSPEAELSAQLEVLAGRDFFTLLRNQRNLGFVETVNRGMRLHEGRDVVLLNSDTVVYDDWLDRLRAHARTPRTGTITPLSTNATICSYPVTLQDNNQQLECSYAALDALCAEVNPLASVEIPTAVGFCCYITRDCLAETGYFDAKTFGRGYGEENDFCRRAAGLGWRNILAADVFVRHTGEVSFCETAPAGQKAAMKAMLRKHPDYMKLVEDYIRRDPALPLRRRVDAARLRAAQGEGAILHVLHNWGGGIERHVRNLVEMMRDDGAGGLVMTPTQRGKRSIGIRALDGMSLPNLQGLDIVSDAEEIAALIKVAGVSRIHVHSLAGWPMGATTAIPRIAGLAGLPFDFTVHDYMPFCPRITFVDGTGQYCGERGISACHRCVAMNGSPFGRVNVPRWRRRFRAMLDAAENVFAPSLDACRRTEAYLDGRKVAFRPHPHGPVPQPAARRRLQDGDTLRVMIVGGINEAKGARLLLAMAREAHQRGLPIEFVIVGHSDRDAEFAALPNMRLTGRYRDGEQHALIAAQEAHCVFFSSVWPETYSYVLTSVMEAGLPIAAFDIGAQAERLRETMPEGSLLLDLALADRPRAINDALVGWMTDLPADLPVPALRDVSYSKDTYYGA